METICLQCGDKGFENAFVYCIQCLQFAVHRYCLDKIPETFDEFVRWRCDDCENEIQKKKRDITYLAAPAIPVEQGCKVDSSKEITEPPLKRTCENAKVASNSKEEKCKGHVGVANNNRHEQGHLIHCSRQNLGPTEKCITDSVLEERGSLITSNTGSNSDGVASHLGRASSRVEEQVNNIPAEPVEDPVWRGDFNIMNKAEGTYDGFVAHISNKACLRVYEEARLLNPLLHLEMFPKSDVWPKSFLKSEPSNESIALYFFPADLSSERVFDALVEEMMENELALKAMSENAELLLFTSTELPILYWRFQGKIYLWGVFRSKQGSGSHQSENSDNVVRALRSANDKDEVPERSPRMSSTIDAWSPVSPLSNSHSYVSGS